MLQLVTCTMSCEKYIVSKRILYQLMLCMYIADNLPMESTNEVKCTVRAFMDCYLSSKKCPVPVGKIQFLANKMPNT